jgi:hypothetical protein
MSTDNPFLNDSDQPIAEPVNPQENQTGGHSVREINITFPTSDDKPTEKKVESLKKSLADLGFKIEDGENGEIKLKH